MKHHQQERPGQLGHPAKHSPEVPLVPLRRSPPRLLQLQRSLGNQAILRLMRSGPLQAKLTLSRPDDTYEQEADRVAEQIVRMPEPTLQTKPG
jgi:hypothetical protein